MSEIRKNWDLFLIALGMACLVWFYVKMKTVGG
jgi:hypothetical protein